jgi:NADH dehydrogenase
MEGPTALRNQTRVAAMAEDLIKTGRIVTVFGGSGFLGRHVVRALAKRGWRIRVATRRPELAFHLQPIGKVGQIHAVQANLRYPASIAAALRGTDAVVNLVAILNESGRQRFDAVHAFGARAVARAARDAGIADLVHVSALGADPNSASAYSRTKAEGEAAVLDAVPQAVILRPSILFGPEDDFFNRFAAIARISPVLPLFGGGHTRFQPAYVGDAADAVALGLDGTARKGTIYEIGGPEVRTFRELMQFVCDTIGRKRFLMPIPFEAASVFARGTEVASMLSMGLYPKMLLTTRDQVTMLRSDNIVSATADAEGRTLRGLGIVPETMEAIVPSYLVRFRKTGQFEKKTYA